MVRPEGLEPPAYRFEACRSIQLSYGRTEGCRHSIALSIARAARGRIEPAHRYARIGFCLGTISARRSPHSPLGPVAQLAEQQPLNLRVVGSIPTRLTSSRIARAA